MCLKKDMFYVKISKSMFVSSEVLKTDFLEVRRTFKWISFYFSF
jgi:hypothetical protein